MDEQEIKDKVSKKIGRRTEGFSQTFSIDEIDLRHEILGEIVKKLPLISYSGYKEIDEIIKDVLKDYVVVPSSKVNEAYDEVVKAEPGEVKVEVTL